MTHALFPQRGILFDEAAIDFRAQSLEAINTSKDATLVCEVRCESESLRARRNIFVLAPLSAMEVKVTVICEFEMAMNASGGTDSRLPAVGSELVLKGRRLAIKEELYKGLFSSVYVVSDGAALCAFKIEDGSARPVLKLDALVLKQLNAVQAVGFPRLYDAGRTPFYKYLLMELVGPDLSKILASLPTQRFSMWTCLCIAKQTLDRIEALHDSGWLCRDVKPQNLCIGKFNSSLIYMLDFGLARRYIGKGGELLEKRSSACFMGTVPYAPLSAHDFSEQCRKDDLESWLYMIIEMITGCLPWRKYDSNDYMVIGEWKVYARGSGRAELLKGCPPEFSDMLDLIDNTSFTARPSYHLLHYYLQSAARRMDGCAKKLDWQVEPEGAAKDTRGYIQ